MRRITSSANANAYNAAKDLQATKYQEAQARLGQNKLKQTELQLKVDRGIATPDDVSQLESLNSSIQQDEAISANLTQEQIDAANADGQKAAEARAARAAKAGQVVGKAASVVNSVVGVADKLMTQDLKMDETSNMIDAGVDTVSNGLMASGNPYAMACVCAGTKVWTNCGRQINIEDLTIQDGIVGYLDNHAIQQPIEALLPPSEKECVEIELESGTILKCSNDHPILSAKAGRCRYITVGKKKQRRIKEYSFKEASLLERGEFVAVINEIPIFGNKHIEDAYLIGLLIGDGSYGISKTPRLYSENPDTWKYIEKNTSGKLIEVFDDG